MIPSIYIVHVAVKLADEQQAPDNSSAPVNKTAVSQTVIHHKGVGHAGLNMHRPAHGQSQSVEIILASSAVNILDCTSTLGSTL